MYLIDERLYNLLRPSNSMKKIIPIRILVLNQYCGSFSTVNYRPDFADNIGYLGGNSFSGSSHVTQIENGERLEPSAFQQQSSFSLLKRVE